MRESALRRQPLSRCKQRSYSYSLQSLRPPFSVAIETRPSPPPSVKLNSQPGAYFDVRSASGPKQFRIRPLKVSMSKRADTLPTNVTSTGHAQTCPVETREWFVAEAGGIAQPALADLHGQPREQTDVEVTVYDELATSGVLDLRRDVLAVVIGIEKQCECDARDEHERNQPGYGI